LARAECKDRAMLCRSVKHLNGESAPVGEKEKACARWIGGHYGQGDRFLHSKPISQKVEVDPLEKSEASY